MIEAMDERVDAAVEGIVGGVGVFGVFFFDGEVKEILRRIGKFFRIWGVKPRRVNSGW